MQDATENQQKATASMWLRRSVRVFFFFLFTSQRIHIYFLINWLGTNHNISACRRRSHSYSIMECLCVRRADECDRKLRWMTIVTPRAAVDSKLTIIFMFDSIHMPIEDEKCIRSSSSLLCCGVNGAAPMLESHRKRINNY